MTSLGVLGRFTVSELPKKAPEEILLDKKKKKIGVGRGTQNDKERSYNLSSFSGSSTL